ncbi:phenylalanine--tRNA ligase subunit alpha [Candidatus Woesearchaeota archaeon]|nr:phenylalanine--tRNA ligase subunit alpha [Candidatus Woesearchaeota archaeon]
MDIKKLAETLTPLEIKILPVLKKYTSFSDIKDKSGIGEVEASRALKFLKNKELISVEEIDKEAIFLGENGKKYLKTGLPEKRLLEIIKDESMSLEEIKFSTTLDKDEINVSIGVLKRKAALDIFKKGNTLILKINDNGRKLLKKEMLEEQFLSKKFPIEATSLTDEERFAYDEFKKRKGIVKKENIKEKTIFLTPTGKKLAASKLSSNVVDKLTSSMLKTGSWKGNRFRRFDIKTKVPQVFGGKRHFMNEATEYVKKIWLELGFKEMTGGIVQTSFWNFDALFTAQDHPIRDLQDTFFLKNSKGKLPSKEVVSRVKKTHETGWTTGSKGWEYKWDPEEARRNVLRTHTTALSAKTISTLKQDELPAKYFSVGKCFRNETIDWSHLFEFNQVEGIVVDPDANFRHLIGYLKEFYHKMGYKDVRVRPAYFPYTEPSAEVDVLDPIHNEWIELGGCGIFRPEVVKPLLGKDIPVLAWGLGFARIVPKYYDIKDLRDLYKNDIKMLRGVKTWLK